MFLKKKWNYHETIHDGATGNKRNHLVQRCRHAKPVCRPSFLETSQATREWLISSTQYHHVLISSPLWRSQKECETNPSGEQRTQLPLQIELVEENHNHFIHRTHRGEHNKCTSWKKQIVTLNVIKKFYMQARNILTNLSPNPDRPETSGPAYSSVTATVFHQPHVTIFVNTDKFSCHCVFICSTFHWQLFAVSHIGSLYCFCLLTGSCWNNKAINLKKHEIYQKLENMKKYQKN